jgi:hypothetical protein
LYVTSPKIVVYTAIVGGHYPMRDDIPVFTDRLRFQCPQLAARFYKTSPHILFPDADWTIWIDGNIFLNKTPEELVAMCKHEFGVFAHIHRNCLYEEAKVCKILKMDSDEAIDRATDRYRSVLGIPENYGLAIGGVLIRKNSPEVAAKNRAWWQEICYGSIRDQISLPTVVHPSTYMPAVDFVAANEYFTRYEV